MIRDWLRNVRKHLLYSTAVLLAVAGSAGAQNPDDLKSRLEAQEREIQELKLMIRAGAVQPAAATDAKLDDAGVKKIVDGYMKEKEDKKKAADAEAAQKLETEGFKVGSDMKLNARWDKWNGFIVETPNKDFTFHVGGRFQEDTVAWTEGGQLKPSSQVGELQDGTYFRRIRINMNGTAWQVFEYNMEFALEQVKEGVPTLDEIFVGEKDIPWLGTVRAGHMRVAQGFEGDQISSSKAMTFMEKSYETDAFYQNFAPGIMVTNSVLDQHVVWMLNAYRQEFDHHNNDGTDFGDGKYGYSGRLTWLPLYEDEGMHLLHLGVSGTWRKAENADPGINGPGLVSYSARPLMRDATGDYGGNVVGGTVVVPTTAGGVATVITPTTLPGNKAKLVTTGTLIADSTAVLGTELFYVCGPFSVQSEWAFTQANNVILGGVSQDRHFNGGYVQASYFLTGEHRTYDRRFGRSDSNYFSGPATNFWVTRDDNGDLSLGRGAWELAARVDYLNLNDGPVNGGVVLGYELGLNWYLNTNVKIQFEYANNNRYDLKAGQIQGLVQSFGTRLQLNF